MALADLEARWTLYPSLLSQLDTAQLQHDLEDAVCAGMCGRHEDVDRIFTHSLPSTSSSPAIALSRADILALHSRELERQSVLKAFISSNVYKADIPDAVRILTNLMLEDSNYWLLGTTQPLINALLRTKAYISSKGFTDLIDVDLRCITMVYSVTDNLASSSNFITLQDRTCYPTFMGDRHSEASAIRKSLEDQGRLRFAPTFMQLELVFADSPAQYVQTVPAAMTLVGKLTEQTQPAIKYRAVLLANQLSRFLDELNMTALSTNIRSMQQAAQQSIIPSQFTDWKSFCPSLAADDSKLSILASSSTPASKYADLKALAAACIASKNYARANQVYVSIRDMLKLALQQVSGTSDDPAIKTLIETNGLELIRFHKQTTKLAFFEAAVLCDYISTMVIYTKPWKDVVELVQDYEARHPLMAIPSVLERLFHLGMLAAQALGDRKTLLHFEDCYSKALRCCHYMNQTGGLASEAIIHPDDAYRVIYADGADVVKVGINALHLMLMLAAYENKNGQLGRSRTAIMFNLNNTEDISILSAEALKELTQTLFRTVCGTVAQPTSSTDFMRTYHRLLEWLLIPERKPSRAVRLDAVYSFINARLYLYRAHLKTQGQGIDDAQYKELSAEEAAFGELKKIQAHEKGYDAGDEELRRVRLLLSRCMLPRAERPVELAELDSALVQCRRFAEINGKNSAWLKEYDWHMKAIGLTWQRTLRVPYRLDEPETEKMIELIKLADHSYHTIKADLESPDASDELVAVFTNASRFTYSEHYRFAFAALHRRYKTCNEASSYDGFFTIAQAEAHKAVVDLANWSLLAKGQGLMDVLHTSRLTRDRSDESKHDVPKNSTSHTSQVGDLGSQLSTIKLQPASDAARLIKPVEAADIMSMVDAAEEEVVVIDVLDLAYSPWHAQLGALVYRKGKHVSLAELAISSGEIEKWLEENLEQPEDNQQTLSSSEAQASLDRLHKLISVFHESPDAECHIPPGVTIIWCSTSSLYRVPVHAIAVDGSPFIERNPIVYAQSISLLSHFWDRIRETDVSLSGSERRVILNPLSFDWESSTAANNLAGMLDRSVLLSGQDISSAQALEHLQGSGLFSFHGHAFFDPRSPLDSAMHLNETSRRYQGTSRYLSRRQQITARDVFNTVLLQFPALCTIIACASGVSAFTSNDDVLSLPTALHYAGASSVVSTLWPVSDHDGAAFSLSFYTKLLEACRAHNSEHAPPDQGQATAGSTKQHKAFINIAKVMQAAVLDVYKDNADGQLRAPYHWAGFYLQGLWLLPASIV